MNYDFECDASYFDILATQQLDPSVKKELQGLVKTYRKLSRSKENLLIGSRQEHWRKRAEECRTLGELATDAFCKGKLTKLAEAYDLLSGDQPITAV